MDIFSYKLGKKAGGGGGGSTLQTKSVNITSNGSTEVSPDEGYDGMSKVNITTSVPSDGFYENHQYTNNAGGTIGDWRNTIKKVSMGSTATNDLRYAFSGFAGEEIEIKSSINTSNVTSMGNMFENCNYIKTIKGLENLDTSNVRDMSNMFRAFATQTTKWNKLDLTSLNTSRVTNLASIFNYCNVDEIDITGWNTSNVQYMNRFCSQSSISKITGLENIDTSRNTTIDSMFYDCLMSNIPEIDCTSVTTAGMALYGTTLTTFGGFKDLGKAYSTSVSAYYSQYRLDLSGVPNLTHDSLLNVINKLYDIATKGVATQKLILGSSNYNKLTAEEIAVATNKGWEVSIS